MLLSMSIIRQNPDVIFCWMQLSIYIFLMTCLSKFIHWSHRFYIKIGDSVTSQGQQNKGKKSVMASVRSLSRNFVHILLVTGMQMISFLEILTSNHNIYLRNGICSIGVSLLSLHQVARFENNSSWININVINPKIPHSCQNIRIKLILKWYSLKKYLLF